MTRRKLIQRLSAAAPATAALLPLRPALAGPVPPNIVVILCDDLGYGDLGCYGSSIRTPNLDRMAAGGAMAQSFCSASPVCSPSRAALLTGRYGVRGGVPYVLGPEQKTGLSLAETTLAQSLKSAGYQTMCSGKWHLGSTPSYLPTARGFDEYFGIPYSNDNAPSVLMHNNDVIEQPVVQSTLTQRYTEQAIQFIRQAKDRPFFLYLAHTFPHIPLAASSRFEGRSAQGQYGDAMEEVDWSVGELLAELEAQGIASNTLVLFTSDNGPWFQGSTGGLRGRKGDTFEGGMRVPFLASWPGQIPRGRVMEGFASMLDVFPTVAALTGAPIPGNPLDGVNIWPMLAGEAETLERPPFLYFEGYFIQCARVGPFKLHFSRFNGPAFAPLPASGRVNLPLLYPELYDMEADPEEAYCVSDGNWRVVSEIRERVEQMLPSFPDQVRAAWADTNRRETSRVNAGEWPSPKT